MSSYATIHLHGSMGKDFEPSYRLLVNTPIEAIRALSTMIPGFHAAMVAGSFRCVMGKIMSRGRKIEEADQLREPWRLTEQDFHLIPVIAGRSSKSTGKIIVGVAIIALAVILAIPSGGTSLGLAAALEAPAITVLGVSISYGAIAAVGVMVALGGIAQAIAPQASTPSQATKDPVAAMASFLFNNLGNTTEAGGAVPFIYGETMVGSQVIGMGIDPQDIGATVVATKIGNKAKIHI